jgi:hypothetical protein
MEKLLLWLGRFAGLAGIVLCALSFGARFMGMWSFGPFQVGTILQAGVAAMVLGCLAYCAKIAEAAAS